MAYSTTYPDGRVSLLGQRLLEPNNMPHITYVGHDGTRYFLAGPLAPVPGAQNGLVLQSITGLMPPFQHLDVQGARQDGTTWLDTVFDPGEYDAVLEASGLTAADTRALIRAWHGSHDPKLRGRLHVFTPENGEWWAKVRQLKTNTDPVTQVVDTPGKQKFTWAWRNDDSFWQSFDSVSSFQMSLTTAFDNFDGTNELNLGSGWAQTYNGFPGLDGVCALSGEGDAKWYPFGVNPSWVINRKIGTGATSSTDSQVISVRFKAPIGFDFVGGTYIDIWGRMNTSNDGIRVRIGGNGFIDCVSLCRVEGGVETTMHWEPLVVPPVWNEKWTLICGTSHGLRNFKIQRGDGSSVFTVFTHTEHAENSHIGASYRGWGFGMAAGAGLAPYILQTPPPSIRRWEAGDNFPVTQSGYLPLQNRGDQDGWPRYLCYGPGTFTFSDGNAPSANTVSFGPLLEDQIVLVTTTPRLRSVIDLSIEEQPPQQLNAFQKALKGLISFATNHNVPPLLEQFESEFGVLPPQGNLYALLDGRFTTPLPPKSESKPPATWNIATSITGGNADSKVVAAVTPQRRWPL